MSAAALLPSPVAPHQLGGGNSVTLQRAGHHTTSPHIKATMPQVRKQKQNEEEHKDGDADKEEGETAAKPKVVKAKAPAAASQPPVASNSREQRETQSQRKQQQPPPPPPPRKSSSSAPVRKVRFAVGSSYRICDIIGEGAYGVVCSAIHKASGMKVAIKKIQPFEHQMFALRTLRELKLLRYWQEQDVSENIITILDLVKAPVSIMDSFHEVYLIQELMETDLHRVIRSQKLSDDHAQYFTYQILRALKAIHSADVIHRDLKPSNLLLNANCDLKVCDFGLARSLRTAEPAAGSETGLMTEYVATRWYRAPEIMLTFKQYSKAIDVWAVGCILAEMISGRPLFPGRDYHDQMSLIMNVLGTPSTDDFYAIGSKRSRDYIRQMPLSKKKRFDDLFPTATPAAIDFLEKTLTFNPKKRWTVVELLEHPYLAAYHDELDEPSCEPMPAEVWACDYKDDLARNSTEKLRQQLYEEILDFEPAI